MYFIFHIPFTPCRKSTHFWLTRKWFYNGCLWELFCSCFGQKIMTELKKKILIDSRYKTIFSSQSEVRALPTMFQISSGIGSIKESQQTQLQASIFWPCNHTNCSDIVHPGAIGKRKGDNRLLDLVMTTITNCILISVHNRHCLWSTIILDTRFFALITTVHGVDCLISYFLSFIPWASLTCIFMVSLDRQW